MSVRDEVTTYRYNLHLPSRLCIDIPSPLHVVFDGHHLPKSRILITEAVSARI